jgi:hypothetical protein
VKYTQTSSKDITNEAVNVGPAAPEDSVSEVLFVGIHQFIIGLLL